jgi:hypothetical protein
MKTGTFDTSGFKTHSPFRIHKSSANLAKPTVSKTGSTENMAALFSKCLSE